MYLEGQIKFSDDYWQSRAELNEDGTIKRDANGTPIIKKMLTLNFKVNIGKLKLMVLKSFILLRLYLIIGILDLN